MIPEEELRRKYWDDKISTYEIASMVGVSQMTIRRWMEKYGIPTRTLSESGLGYDVDVPTKEKLYDMYCVQYMSQNEIAKKIGVSQPTIGNLMKKYGIESRTVSETLLYGISVLSEEELYNLYWVQEMSMTEIAKKVGVVRSTINVWMKKYEIKTRIHSDFVGEKNGNWKNGISSEPYCYKFNNIFKEAVRERDDYTCQLCGFEQNGRKLDVHHIHYDKENCYPDVVALCRSCNSRVNGDRDYWEQYFENQLIDRGLYCWSLNDIVA